MDQRHSSPLLIGLIAAATGLGALQQSEILPREQPPTAQLARTGLAETRFENETGHTLQRSRDGLFYLTAKVDGVAVRFVVDTGANVTVLSPADARRIDWRRDQLAGSAVLATASGSAAMRWARVDAIDVAGHTMTDIDAALPASGTSTSLLGQDVLSNFHSVTQRGDRLTIQ